MGSILKLLCGPFGTYALIAVGAMMLGLGAYGTYQHVQLKASRTELASSKRDLQIAMRAVISKDATIAKQSSALDQWRSVANARAASEQEAVKRVQQSKYDAFVANQKLHELEKQDYALPECAKYLAIDVAATCPAMAAGVRQRAASGFR